MIALLLFRKTEDADRLIGDLHRETAKPNGWAGNFFYVATLAAFLPASTGADKILYTDSFIGIETLALAAGTP